MADKHFDDGRVLIPQTVGELLQILKQFPEITIWSGGTDLMLHGAAQRYVALHDIAELRHVVRSARWVDIGSAVRLGRLRETGLRFLPAPLLQALDRVGPPHIANSATAGGILCVPAVVYPLSTALGLLDAEVELRRTGGSRWVSLPSFQQDGPQLREGEFVSRIRLQLRPWSLWRLTHFGSSYPGGAPGFAIALDRDKRTIAETRLLLTTGGARLLRLLDAENDLTGQALPLTERELRAVIARVDAALPARMARLTRHQITESLRRFLGRAHRSVSTAR